MSTPATHAVSRRCEHVRDGISPTSLRAGTNHCTRCYPHVPDFWEDISVPNESLPPASNTSSMDAEAGSEKSSEAGSSCATGDTAPSEDDNLSGRQRHHPTAARRPQALGRTPSRRHLKMNHYPSPTHDLSGGYRCHLTSEMPINSNTTTRRLWAGSSLLRLAHLDLRESGVGMWARLLTTQMMR
jgi:hypothetical protein